MLENNKVEAILNKWKPILEDIGDMGPIKDTHRKIVTAQCLENLTEAQLTESKTLGRIPFLTEANVPTNVMGASSSTAGTGPIDIFDPVLISMIRRTMPNLMAYDVCGIQPMTGPTGLIFALRSRYANQSGAENFYNEVNTAYSTVVSGANTLGQKHVGHMPGNNTVVANLAATGIYNFGTGMSTSQMEALGSTGNTAWPQMGLSIEKIMVEAEGRALAAEYSLELAQDSKAVHGLDIEQELSTILTTEIMAEINREIIRTINVSAVPGAQENTTTPGFFNLDTDSNGRWFKEKHQSLFFQIEREANRIAKETRRGKGNFIICSADVASAMQLASILDYSPALNSNNLQVDDTGATFAGVLNGRTKVFIDPYADSLLGGYPGLNYVTVGYKGVSPYDAGLFYCPYIPMQMVRAVQPDNFTPRIGFKTRYGMVAHPFAEGSVKGNGAIKADSNRFYRRLAVLNLL